MDHEGAEDREGLKHVDITQDAGLLLKDLMNLSHRLHLCIGM
jgi:hypothetical protein